MGKAETFFDLNSDVSLSAGHDRMIVFARRESGELAHISEVQNGKACGCYCLACSEALIARQGNVREHSFAHQSGTQCQHAIDAMLHGVVARLIERHRQLVTPELRVSASVPGPHGPIADSRVQPAIKVPVDSVALVQRAPWRHACVEASVKGHTVLIHVALKRPTSAAKGEVLAQSQQAAIELDLSRHGPRTVTQLARLLFDTDDRKTWLFNPKSAAIGADIRAALQPLADQRWLDHHAAAEHQRSLQHQRAVALEQQRIERERRLAALVEQERLHIDAAPAQTVRQHAKPEELSPAVEYTSPAGRLWLLHSSGTDIYVRVEPGMQQVLDVLGRCGAMRTEHPGVWRILPGGWSNASIALGRVWSSIRTVTSTTQ
jgi:hypothetical protein